MARPDILKPNFDLSEFIDARIAVNPGSGGAPAWVTNAQDGLQNFRYSLARAALGMGGTDIVVLGNSISGGAFGTDYSTNNMWLRLRNKMQGRYNPPSVPGGFGYVPLVINGGTWTRTDDPVGSQSNWIWTPSNAASWTIVPGSSSLQVGMRRSIVATNGNNSCARYVFVGGAADAEANKFQVTDIELVTSTFVGDATITWDTLTSDAFVAVGGGAATGTITGNAATNYGIHQGRQLSGATPGSTNGIQIGIASGTANSRPDGLIAYNGDWDCGVRLHNQAINGARSDYLTTSVNTLSACISKWGSTAPGGTPAGATQMGLCVLEFYLNDVGLSATPTLTLAQFTANMTLAIQTAQACPSLPSVLLFIPQVRNDADTLANYLPYIEALYTLADTYNCAVVDMKTYFGNVNYTATPTAVGWGYGDGTHYSNIGQEGHAQVFFNLLTQ